MGSDAADREVGHSRHSVDWRSGSHRWNPERARVLSGDAAWTEPRAASGVPGKLQGVLYLHHVHHLLSLACLLFPHLHPSSSLSLSLSLSFPFLLHCPCSYQLSLFARRFANPMARCVNTASFPMVSLPYTHLCIATGAAPTEYISHHIRAVRLGESRDMGGHQLFSRRPVQRGVVDRQSQACGHRRCHDVSCVRQ